MAEEQVVPERLLKDVFSELLAAGAQQENVHFTAAVCMAVSAITRKLHKNGDPRGAFDLAVAFGMPSELAASMEGAWAIYEQRDETQAKQ